MDRSQQQDSLSILGKVATHLITKLADGLDHPEIWQEIAASAAKGKESIIQLADYLAQLMKIPQDKDALFLIAVLEAVCQAYGVDEKVGMQKLKILLQQHPQSLLIKGALLYIEQHTVKLSKPAHETDALMKAFSTFMSAQQAINTILVNKMQTLENMIAMHLPLINKQLQDTQQTLHLTAKRIPRPARRIRVVFLVSFLQSWNTLADVYAEMKASDDFEPIVVSTARKRAKDTQAIFGEELTHEFLEAEGVPHLRLNTALADQNCMDILKVLDPDIIFRQSPYHDLPPIFNPAEINFARLCYIPYSFTAVRRLDDQEPENAECSVRHTDLYYHRLCWRIFCETEMHKEMYINTSVRAGHNVVVTGYPKFDRLAAAKTQPGIWPIKPHASNKKRFRIIWAPHHSVTQRVMGFGTFVETYQAMYEWAKRSESLYEFVLKPHPALAGEVVHAAKALTQAELDAYFAAWNALPNATLFEGGEYGSLFAGSDAMLTDGVGFLSEYQLFEKPLIFIDSGRHFGFNQAGKIMMQSANTVKSIMEAEAFCERLRQGEQDPMKAQQQQVLSQIRPYPNQSAKRIMQAIYDGLKTEGVI